MMTLFLIHQFDFFFAGLWSPKQLNNNEHSHPMAGGHDFGNFSSMSNIEC
jgi:hypothetical protein